MRVYLDTNVFIRFVESDATALGRLIDRADAGRLTLTTSELTLAETLVVPMRLGRRDLIDAYEALLSGTLIEVLPISRRILTESAAIRATIGNKGMDAIHVATAVLADCTVFVSSDAGLRLPPAIEIVTPEALESGETLL